MIFAVSVANVLMREIFQNSFKIFVICSDTLEVMHFFSGRKKAVITALLHILLFIKNKFFQ